MSEHTPESSMKIHAFGITSTFASGGFFLLLLSRVAFWLLVGILDVSYFYYLRKLKMNRARSCKKSHRWSRSCANFTLIESLEKQCSSEFAEVTLCERK